MSDGFTDWKQLGIFPLQDHEDGVRVGMRQQIVGGRLVKMLDTEGNTSPGESMQEYGAEFGLGTLGDVHPWFFWQTANRGLRDSGMWSMAHSGLTVTGGTGGFPPGGGTGHPVSPSGLLPFRSAHNIDGRFRVKFPNWPKCFSSIPKGTMMMVMPGTLESGQSEHMLHADPRIVAPSIDGPYQAGTLVVDVQPEGEMCMGDGDSPGVVGRAALIQSMMRVIPLNANSGIPEAKDLNGLAWNMAATGKGKKFPGLGMCWIEMEQGGGGSGGGPITPRFTKPLTHPRGGPNPGGGGTEASAAGSPCKFGEFEKSSVNGHGTTLMAQKKSCGPLSGGSGSGDKHYMGDCKDGNPITSGHISRNAYFFMDDERDGPLFFEDKKWPKPGDLPMVSHVHLVFDKEEDHKWLETTKDGQWKWYATVPYFCPDPGGGRPFTPTRDPRKPLTHFTGGRSDAVRNVGELSADRHALFEIFHPMVEGFAQMSFRPELMVKGAQSFRRNPEASLESIKADEARRPQILGLRTWGAQNNSGDWTYVADPDTSRARGGTADGGVLLSPPEYELEDYFAINSAADVYTVGTTSYFTAAPGTGFGLGTPNSDGGLNAKAIQITQAGGAALNDPLIVAQLNSSRVAKTLFKGELDQASGEVLVTIGGTNSMIIPAGVTGDRPTGAVGMFRTNTTTSPDTLEYWDGAAWATVADVSDVLVLDGAQAMTGDIDMAANDILDVGKLAVGSDTAPVALVDVSANPAATPDDTKSLSLINLTTATVGAQKYSPMLRYQGSGHGTTAGDPFGCEWRNYVIPVQGLVPTVDFIWESEVEGSAWTEQMKFHGATRILEVANRSPVAGVGLDAAVAHCGNWTTADFAIFAHTTVKATAGSYAVRQQNEGTTFLNAASGKILYHRINDATIMQMDANGLGFGGASTAPAALRIISTTQGFGKPSMTTTQRNAIGSPFDGLEIWNSTTGTTDTYDVFAVAWVATV